MLATIPVNTISASSNSTNIESIPQETRQTYTTKSGDSLWSIANEFNVSVSELKLENGLSSDTIQIGKQLIIPTKNLSSIQMSINYTVKSGDNLWTLANKYNTTVDEIRKVNNLKSDVLQIGDILKIPQTITTTPVQTPQTINYTVKSGDNLSVIAKRYNTTVDEIRKVNNLKSDVLQIGDILKIPQTITTNPVQTPQTINYTVKSDDNLWVANRYNTTVDQLRTINNLKTDTLQIGDVLQIPQNSTPITTAPVQTPQTINYTVKSGDNLWVIANRYNTTVDQLRTINNLKTDVLQIGDVLQIPQNSTPITTTPVETPQTINYTVKSGDNLWVIANRYNTTVDQLRTLNNLKTDTLQIGDVLQIPQNSNPITTTPVEAPQANSINYTVKPGESLWSIANTYNVSVDQIRNVNNLKTDVLSIGQTLIIPIEFDSISKDVLYIVKTGDTIESIASSFNISVASIMEANNLSSRNIINNQSLIIPFSNYSNETNVILTKYIVQSGDDLWKISKKFAVSIDSIRKASNLRSDNLDIGQELTIPTTIINNDYNRTTLEWLVEAQYNMTPTSVFHDVTVSTQEYWAKATKEQIRYYANPDNFSNDEIQKYQFLVLNYHSEIDYTKLNLLLNNKGVFEGQGATFDRAASTYNVSQVYLTSHALLETGNGTSALANGILVTEVDGKAVTPRVVYNMYGINAFDYNPNKAGA